MTDSFTKGQPENTYVIDAESGAEMARLIDQDHLITQAMGGLFSEREEVSGLFDVLDIGCGPGGWVLDVARRYPEIEVTGIDISQGMVRYAKAYAQVSQLPNAHFQVMNALEPLEFPDASFDLVNARIIVGFVRPETFPQLLAEVKRVLRPGGIFRITEAEHGFSNKAAVETFYSLLNRAVYLSGRSFSPTGAHLGITAVLGHLLRVAGFKNVANKAAALDFSVGTPAHEAVRHDLTLAFHLLQPFLLSQHVVTQEEVEQLYERAIEEMYDEDFCAIWHLLTVWGQLSSDAE